MSLYTRAIASMVETYVEKRVVGECREKAGEETMSNRDKLENAQERCPYLMC